MQITLNSTLSATTAAIVVQLAVQLYRRPPRNVFGLPLRRAESRVRIFSTALDAMPLPRFWMETYQQRPRLAPAPRGGKCMLVRCACSSAMHAGKIPVKVVVADRVLAKR
jgi:hypothetical protein